MKFLVIGGGSIGTKHIKNLMDLGHECFIYDIDHERVTKVAKKFGISILDPLSFHLQVDAWVICTPPEYHPPFGYAGIEHKVHLFIEKPLANTIEYGGKFVTEAYKYDKVVYVGYQFRHHPALVRMKQLIEAGAIGRLLSIRGEFAQFLPCWHPYEDYRRLYTIRDGIILDASHEIDTALWLSNASIIDELNCIGGHRSDLDVLADDTADITLRTNTGVDVNIHVDCVQAGYSRWVTATGTMGTLHWKYNDFSVEVKTLVYGGGGFAPAVVESTETVEPADMYIEEMKHFIACIEGKEKPNPGIQAAFLDLEVALACKKIIAEVKK